MNSKGALADLEAAHERVRAAKTTPDWRDAMRVLCNNDISINGEEQTPRSFLDLLDDFAALEAELAALRRVEAENLSVMRYRKVDATNSELWCVGDSTFNGDGASLTEALADYDTRKEQR